MATVSFTKNFRDRSNDAGFQFEFFCDRGYGQWMPNWLSYHFPESCNYSYVSSLQAYPLGIANKIKDVSNWLSNRFPEISKAGDAVNTFHREAWDAAFNAAVEEAKRHFRQCTSCNKWVCAHACFNDTTGTCRSCSGLGFASPKQTNGAKSNTIVCRHCGDTTENGKFCATCGKATAMNIFCGACGKTIESDRRFRFCPHCGDSLSYLDEIYKRDEESA